MESYFAMKQKFLFLSISLSFLCLYVLLVRRSFALFFFLPRLSFLMTELRFFLFNSFLFLFSVLSLTCLSILVQLLPSFNHFISFCISFYSNWSFILAFNFSLLFSTSAFQSVFLSFCLSLRIDGDLSVKACPLDFFSSQIDLTDNSFSGRKNASNSLKSKEKKKIRHSIRQYDKRKVINYSFICR